MAWPTSWGSVSRRTGGTLKQQEETQQEVRLGRGVGSRRHTANFLMGLILTLTGNHEMISGMRVSHQICILEELFQQQSQVWIRGVRV